MRTGPYLRISQDREGQQLGEARQDEDLRAKAARDGDEIVDTYMDNDVSASTLSSKHRPGYERLIADAKSGKIEKITAYTTSRLTRRPREHEDLIDLSVNYGIVFDFVASPAFDLNTANGRQIARMLAAADASNPEITSELVRRKKLQKATDGEFQGSPRGFGWEKDGVTPVPEEIAVLREIARRLLALESTGSIVRDLNRRGVLTARGGHWRTSTVRSTILRPRVAGLIVRDGVVLSRMQGEPALDEAEWRAVVSLFSEPGRRRNGAATGRRLHLGTGLYRCGRCGLTNPEATMKSHDSKARKGQHVRGYMCRVSADVARVAAPLDDYVESLVVARLAQPDAIGLLMADAGPDLPALHEQANVHRARLDDLAAAFAGGLIDARQLQVGTAKLRGLLADTEAEIAKAASVSALAGLAGNPDVARLWFGDLEDRSDGLPVGRREAVVDALMTVWVMPARPGRKPGGAYFDPASVRIEWKV